MNTALQLLAFLIERSPETTDLVGEDQVPVARATVYSASPTPEAADRACDVDAKFLFRVGWVEAFGAPGGGKLLHVTPAGRVAFGAWIDASGVA